MRINDIKDILEFAGYKLTFENDCIKTLDSTPNGHDIAFKVFIEEDVLSLVVKTFRRFGIDKDPHELNETICELTNKNVFFKFSLSDTNEIVMKHEINADFVYNPCVIGAMMDIAGTIVDQMDDDKIGIYSGI